MKHDTVAIYCIHNVYTDRYYVGSSTTPKERMSRHFVELRSGYKAKICRRRGSVWQLDFNLFGEKSFERIILEEHVPLSDRYQREQFYIDKFNSVNVGYNSNDAVHTGLEVKYRPRFDGKPFKSHVMA